jgi:sodium transport system ATP-binding protein
MVIVEHLSKSYQHYTAVDDVGFSVPVGQVYGLLGPNGAGKTTILRVLATLLHPSRGTARVAGFDVARQPLEVRQNLGLVNGGMQVYERLSGKEVLQFFGGLYGIEGQLFRERLDWVTQLLALEPILERRVQAMSTGMRQKIVIARAILHQPRVLLLDEATAGLDVFARRAVLDFVQQYRSLGNTLLYSTHVMSEAEEVCDRVGFLHQGRLVYQADLSEAQQRGHGSLERAFIRTIEGAA